MCTHFIRHQSVIWSREIFKGFLYLLRNLIKGFHYWSQQEAKLTDICQVARQIIYTRAFLILSEVQDILVL